MSNILRSLRKSFAGKPLDPAALDDGAAPAADPVAHSSPRKDKEAKDTKESKESKEKSASPRGKEDHGERDKPSHRRSGSSKGSKSDKSDKKSKESSERHSRRSQSKSHSHSRTSSKSKSKKDGKRAEPNTEPITGAAEPRHHHHNKDDDLLDDDYHDDSTNFDPADSSEEGSQFDFMGDYDFKEDHSADEHRHVSDFSCLSPEQIIMAQKKAIQEVADLLLIPASNASNLIRHYQWKTEKLLAVYFDNPDKVIKEAGLIGHDEAAGTRAVLTGREECLVCCEETEATAACALTCQHRFCRDCWRSYLTLKVQDGEVLRINCLATGCKLTVPDEVIKDMVLPEHYEKYLRFVTKSFVEDNDHVTWCVAPGCGNAIHADQVSGLVVKCSCGYSFCFSCHSEDHRPANCDELGQWRRKCSDESETSHWLGANTKDCPKCRVAVEKNGGCMHMTCRQCGYEWCWLCMKVWKGHTDYYACAKYEKASKKQKEAAAHGKKGSKKAKLQQLEEEREAKRKALERYLNYYQKFLEFDAAVKRAPELLEKARARMEALQAESSTLAEVRFLEKGARVLSDCYLALRNSYMHSYFIEDEFSAEKQLFLFLQAELEKTTGALATALDAPNILKRRTEVVDMSVLAQTKKDNILKAVEHGLFDQ